MTVPTPDQFLETCIAAARAGGAVSSDGVTGPNQYASGIPFACASVAVRDTDGVAAGSLMITEAGGRCEHLDGGELNLGHGIANVMASNGRVHAALFDLIQRTDR